MSLIIPTRIFLILLLILIAYTGGNPFDIEWTKITGGVCEEFSGAKCLKVTGISAQKSLAKSKFSLHSQD